MTSTNSGNGAAKRVVAQVEADLRRLAQQRGEAHAALAAADRAATAAAILKFRGTKDAAAKVRDAKEQRGAAVDMLAELDAVEVDLQRELVEARATGDQLAREADAKAAKEFAAGLPNLFHECDRHLADFRRSYVTCQGAVREARAKRWSVPSEELMVSKMVRAIKTAFSVAELRALDMSPISSEERCTFASLGESYAAGVIGGAKQSLTPKPPPKPAAPSPAVPSPTSEAVRRRPSIHDTAAAAGQEVRVGRR